MDPGTARLITLFEAGVGAVQPGPLVTDWMSGHRFEPTHVIASGKAAAGMAAAALAAAPGANCLIATNEAVHLPPHTRVFVSSHPLPDAASVRAGFAALAMAERLDERHRLLVLLSGGASSMTEAPQPGIGIADLIEMNRILLACGAGIADVNAVRIGASRLKGGGLGAAAAPAAVVTLVISDVVGSDVSTIGSGPTVGGDRHPAEVVARLGIEDALPDAVRGAIARYAPSPASGAEVHVLADGAMASRAIVDTARKLGIDARLGSTSVTGEAAIQARRLVARSGQGLVVHAGETTVTLSGHPGSGGRNQEAALAAAIEIEGRDGIRFLAAGTDGVDGSTEAAGAIVDGHTASRMRSAGVNPEGALESHASGTAHARAGTAIITGPTGTNVGDVWLVERAGRDDDPGGR